MQSQKRYTPTFSMEFFPPKSEQGREKLIKTRDTLAQLGPAYVSVTFGAGGSTQEGTVETVREMIEAGLDAAPHLSCIGSNRRAIGELLEGYRQMGVKRIVALRGDLPSGQGRSGEFRYANELVEFIRAETGDHFKLEVAAYPEVHPQAPSAQADLQNFKRKVEAGADAAITQYFYNVDAYFRFVDDCERMGIDLPVIPGVMPIINFSQLSRFSAMCGAEIPRWMRLRLEGFGDDKESIRAFGEDVVTELCERLLAAGAPGIHFYTMNQVQATRSLWQNLGLKPHAS